MADQDPITPPDRHAKAYELVIAVRAAGMSNYVDVFHAPECGIPEGEYYRVTVERVELAPVRFDVREVYTSVTPVYDGVLSSHVDSVISVLEKFGRGMTKEEIMSEFAGEGVA